MKEKEVEASEPQSHPQHASVSPPTGTGFEPSLEPAGPYSVRTWSSSWMARIAAKGCRDGIRWRRRDSVGSRMKSADRVAVVVAARRVEKQTNLHNRYFRGEEKLAREEELQRTFNPHIEELKKALERLKKARGQDQGAKVGHRFDF